MPSESSRGGAHGSDKMSVARNAQKTEKQVQLWLNEEKKTVGPPGLFLNWPVGMDWIYTRDGARVQNCTCCLKLHMLPISSCTYHPIETRLVIFKTM